MNQVDAIEKAIVELFSREKAFVAACEELAVADADYKRARAVAFLRAEGTMGDKNAKADAECWEQHKRKLAAEATHALTKALLEDCRQVLSARQSILSANARLQQAMDTYATKQT